ncbi:MAG TPA: 50S ribosomal protein L18 [Fibrobacteres bacterium]|jgi:large subunit ribosomal protein L18|nr:50S ribosomal protein L18 [Fibrobacterota bacterium]
MIDKVAERKKRALRIRKTVIGTSVRPRLAVRRSLNHIYAQIIDDSTGKSLLQIGSNNKDIVAKMTDKKKVDISRLLGEIVAEKAKEKGIEKVVFDRKGYTYHGRVKALADGARKKGLQF